MSHNRVWLGKYKQSVHLRASPDPVRPCTTDRIVTQNRTYGCPHGRMESTGAPRVPAREPYGTCRVQVRYLATPWPKNTQITHWRHVCMWPQQPVMPTRAPGPMTLRKSVWNHPLFDVHIHLHTGVLWASCLWSENRRKPVSESCASSAFSYGHYGAHMGLNIFDKACGLARHVVGLPTGYLVFDQYGARELLESFMWPSIWVILYGLSRGHRLKRHPNPHGHETISDGLSTGHKPVRHPNPHGHETTRRSHVTLYYLFSLLSSDTYFNMFVYNVHVQFIKRGPHGNWSYQIGLLSVNKGSIYLLT